MASRSKSEHPLIVIVGETGVGKSALALRIATEFDGEIIAADSRTVYKGLDIGTAKPSPSERKLVKHHLLDVTSLDEPLTVVEFKRLAVDAILNIQSRKKLPILVGGSGLYIDAVIFDYDFLPAPDPQLRDKLNSLSINQLQTIIKKRNINPPTNFLNKRHLIRAIETNGASPSKQLLRPNTLVIGLRLPKSDLSKRLKHRAEDMLNQGLVKEAESIANKYNWDIEALRTPAYRSVRQYLEGDINKDEIVGQCVRFDMQLANKQRTWFKRNKSIQWADKQIQAVDLITTFLNKQ